MEGTFSKVAKTGPSIPPPLDTPAPSTAVGARRSSVPPQPPPKNGAFKYVAGLGCFAIGMLGFYSLVMVPSQGRQKGSLAEAVRAKTPGLGGVFAKPAAVVEVPADIVTENTTTLCVESHLPHGTFGENPDLDFVCEEASAWTIGERIYKVIAQGGGQGEGVTLWAHLGWFELSAVSALRHDCCDSAKPLKAATPTRACPSLEDAVNAVGAEASPTTLVQYEEAAICLQARKIKAPARYRRVTAEQSKKAIGEFFASVRHQHDAGTTAANSGK